VWPVWEFMQEDDKFVFVNKTIVGEIREEFCANGVEYTTLNGWRQAMTCKAFWEDQTLVIIRSSLHGPFREERMIDASGVLQFTLRGLEPPVENKSWGRTFERDDSNEAVRAMEVQLLELGFDADEVQKVVGEAASVEEAANLLIERREAPPPSPSFWDILSGLGGAQSAKDDEVLPGKYQVLKQRVVVSSRAEMNDAVDHMAEGDFVDIVAVHVVEDNRNVVGQLADQRWISIMAEGELIAERISLAQQLLELGFSDVVAQKAAELHSSLEAAVSSLVIGGQTPVICASSGTCRPGKYQIVKQHGVTTVVSSSDDMVEAVHHLEEGDFIDIVEVEYGEENGTILGKMADERWISITSAGEPIAKRISLVQELVELGFSETQAQDAARRTSSVEAGVAFLSDTSKSA